jgi:hypothetical protein
VPDALRSAGEEVKVHDDCFPPGTQDHVWLRTVGESGWVILTKDSRIRYRRNEMEALLSSGARSFVLVSRNLPGSEMAGIFIRALPGMKKLCAVVSAPFIAHVHHDGKVILMKSIRKPG